MDVIENLKEALQKNPQVMALMVITVIAIAILSLLAPEKKVLYWVNLEYRYPHLDASNKLGRSKNPSN
jgi:hypothetical protein